MDSFLKDCKPIMALAVQAAGTGQLNTSIIDTGGTGGGYDRVAFIVQLGAVTDASLINVAIQDSADNAATNMTNIGTAANLNAATSSNTNILVEVMNPQKRYVRCIINRATQNAAVSSVLCLLGGAKNKPVTADATLAASSSVVATG